MRKRLLTPFPTLIVYPSCKTTKFHRVVTRKPTINKIAKKHLKPDNTL
jgi:hypothetical protein